MNDDYRITGYCENEDFCFIMDCSGMFEKLWQFSSLLVRKGFTVLEAGSDSKFLDGNIRRLDKCASKIFLRAASKGKPEYVEQAVDGATYRAVKVGDAVYVPDRTQKV